MIEVVGFVEDVGERGRGLAGRPEPAARISCGDTSSAGRAAGDHATQVLQEEFNKKSLTPLSVLVPVGEKKVTKDAQRSNSYKFDLNINEYTLQSEFSFK